MNEIKTWKQGKFVDRRQYRNWTNEMLDKANSDESHLVRPAPTESAICRCENPKDAKWIASRLNLASTLEQMTYDYATGKSDGQEIVDLVNNAVG